MVRDQNLGILRQTYGPTRGGLCTRTLRRCEPEGREHRDCGSVSTFDEGHFPRHIFAVSWILLENYSCQHQRRRCDWCVYSRVDVSVDEEVKRPTGLCYFRALGSSDGFRGRDTWMSPCLPTSVLPKSVRAVPGKHSPGTVVVLSRFLSG